MLGGKVSILVQRITKTININVKKNQHVKSFKSFVGIAESDDGSDK